jgi:hypothetical protein
VQVVSTEGRFYWVKEWLAELWRNRLGKAIAPVCLHQTGEMRHAYQSMFTGIMQECVHNSSGITVYKPGDV